MKIFLVGFGILFLLTCTSACVGGSWPSEERDKFLSECEAEGGDTGYCKCYLDGVMEKYPNSNDAKKIDFETSVELAGKCK